ncbi:MAG: DUF2852 domain-containing protein [Tabrizicola sp.]|nr:DUF2852 domain-containing protein [Tabrizicola sp.]
MNSYYDTARPSGFTSWPRRAENWLDQRGRGAWIAAMVLGFIFFWPVGLALLAYMIWGKQMFGKSCAHRREGSYGHGRHWDRRHGGRPMASSGNAAFENYKAETLRRLEEEQEAFEAFLQRLRDAKDKSEFDTFMDDRARANQSASDESEVPPAAQTPKAGEGARPGEY